MAPGKAVDYMVFVCVNVASLCEGGGSFTNGICFLIYPVHSCVQMLMGPNTHFIKTSLVCFHHNFFFTFLSCVLVVTHCRVGEL